MRDVKALHPELQCKIMQLQKLCKDNGLIIGIGECVRTVAEQDALYAQGRTKKGNIVTNAKGSTYSSQHQWYIACDFFRNDGKGAFNDSDGFFSRVGKLAKSIGLGWGGDWKSPVDKPHLYLPQWGSTTAKLKQQYGTPEKFKKTWKLFYETNKNYTTTRWCYLRKSAGVGSGKVAYDSISGTVKKRCTEKSGFAVFDGVFRLVKLEYKGGDLWGQMKSGYWIPLIYKGISRAKLK